jgi:division protein CdvB (Snf7/Vps24/ESCRT-III family)
MENNNTKAITETLENCLATIDRMDKRLDGIIELLDSMKKVINDTQSMVRR